MQQTIPIFVEDKKYFIYKDKKYWASSNGRYFYADYRETGKRKKKALHRQIWEDFNNKKIPNGFHIHHIDNNTKNNNPTNLECINGSKHISQHTLLSFKSPKYRAEKIRLLIKNRWRANKWHASQEGYEWHKQNSINMWKNKKPIKKICSECGIVYFSKGQRGTVCSTRCIQRKYARTKKYHDVKKICQFCNKEFIASRVSNAKCCSPKCSAIKRWHK